MDFAAGFAAGYAFAKKKFEGGGGSEYINNDPDYALYKALPEPAENQAVILLRIVDCTQKSYLGIHYDPNIPSEDISENEGTVDWGDGTTENIGRNWSSNNHAYDAPGDYVIIVTDNSSGKIESVCSSKQRNYGYPIALKVGASLIYDDGMGSKYINSSSGFKYIQFASDYFWENEFVFNGTPALTRVDFLGSTKPSKLLNNQFNGCNALDFENLSSLFSEVTEIGNYVFNCCYGLKKLSLPKCTKVGYSSIYQCSILTNVDLPLCTEIGNSSIAQCYSLTQIDLPKCTKVGNSSIYQCFSLTHVDMPLCTEIGNYAVGYNFSLREANLPLCAAVGNYGLAYNYSLNKVVLAEECTYGSNALNYCYCLIPSPNGIYPY